MRSRKYPVYQWHRFIWPSSICSAIISSKLCLSAIIVTGEVRSLHLQTLGTHPLLCNLKRNNEIIGKMFAEFVKSKSIVKLKRCTLLILSKLGNLKFCFLYITQKNRHNVIVIWSADLHALFLGHDTFYIVMSSPQ